MDLHIAEKALDAALEALESHPDKYCARKLAIERISEVANDESGYVECPGCGQHISVED